MRVHRTGGPAAEAAVPTEVRHANMLDALLLMACRCFPTCQRANAKDRPRQPVIRKYREVIGRLSRLREKKEKMPTDTPIQLVLGASPATHFPRVTLAIGAFPD